jgi:hypothetical protein
MEPIASLVLIKLEKGIHLDTCHEHSSGDFAVVHCYRLSVILCEYSLETLLGKARETCLV